MICLAYCKKLGKSIGNHSALKKCFGCQAPLWLAEKINESSMIKKMNELFMIFNCCIYIELWMKIYVYRYFLKKEKVEQIIRLDKKEQQQKM